jgi:(E)-4-hydroxy-3-methylbut-2-enyl-diphosphate synthase
MDNIFFSNGRFKTREVLVGNIGIGGNNPIRIQSMLNTKTQDVDACVKQILDLEEAGAEIVRLTVQGLAEVKACEKIRSQLIQKKSSIPLVADIHFFPEAALQVIDFVDKVRINPGNFIDKSFALDKTFNPQNLGNEKEKIQEKLIPLIEKCKKQKKSLRIGVNHGSLSSRMVYLYGNTEKGMVESALEYASIAKENDFHALVFSLKASCPKQMIKAYELLVEEMIKRSWNYPLHLGVTEAGFGLEGRIKSSLGIGSLLLKGIGDTIRVSLTEDPIFEIEPAQRLCEIQQRYQKKCQTPLFTKFSNEKNEKPGDLLVLPIKNRDIEEKDFEKNLSLNTNKAPQYLLLKEKPSLKTEKILNNLSQHSLKILNPFKNFGLPLFSFDEQSIPENSAVFVQKVSTKSIKNLLMINPSLVLFEITLENLSSALNCIKTLKQRKLKIPIILYCRPQDSRNNAPYEASSVLGLFLLNDEADGICIDNNDPYQTIQELSLIILQGSKRRRFKAEFISCPGCGRTSYDLQAVAKEIKEKLSHLTHLKIAVMGCSVNGPGEMADADFGYVGSGKNQVDLYYQKTCIEKNIPANIALEKLISLIQDKNLWTDP